MSEISASFFKRLGDRCGRTSFVSCEKRPSAGFFVATIARRHSDNFHARPVVVNFFDYIDTAFAGHEDISHDDIDADDLRA